MAPGRQAAIKQLTQRFYCWRLYLIPFWYAVTVCEWLLELQNPRRNQYNPRLRLKHLFKLKILYSAAALLSRLLPVGAFLIAGFAPDLLLLAAFHVTFFKIGRQEDLLFRP